jgi:hypothetical protein
MASWRAFPERSWSEVRGSLSGFGRGSDPYGLSYVTDTVGMPILNGRISARLRLGYADRAVGAGVVCRADDLRSFVTFHITSDPDSPGLFSVRLAAFKYGAAVATAALTAPFSLTNSEMQISLQFFSGNMRGELVSGDNSAVIEHLMPERPFAGHAGLVRFYSAPVFAREVHIEEIRARPILPEATEKASTRQYKYDVFVSHARGDNDLISRVLERFRQAGISYWIDEEQLTFGDQIVAKIEDGLRFSRFVVVALSERLGKSGWSRSEYGPILFREFSGDTSRRVIPLSLDGSDSERAIPLLLSDKMRADFTSDQSFKAFLAFIKQAATAS